MRAFDKEVVIQQFDELLESIAEEGPFAVQSDGKDVVVFLSPEHYDAMINASPTARGTTKPRFPLSRE